MRNKCIQHNWTLYTLCLLYDETSRRKDDRRLFPKSLSGSAEKQLLIFTGCDDQQCCWSVSCYRALNGGWGHRGGLRRRRSLERLHSVDTPLSTSHHASYRLWRLRAIVTPSRAIEISASDYVDAYNLKEDNLYLPKTNSSFVIIRIDFFPVAAARFLAL